MGAAQALSDALDTATEGLDPDASNALVKTPDYIASKAIDNGIKIAGWSLTGSLGLFVLITSFLGSCFGGAALSRGWMGGLLLLGALTTVMLFSTVDASLLGSISIEDMFSLPGIRRRRCIVDAVDLFSSDDYVAMAIGILSFVFLLLLLAFYRVWKRSVPPPEPINLHEIIVENMKMKTSRKIPINF